jgi:mediator of RNA polymerase II transcription subunit 16, fungi type
MVHLAWAPTSLPELAVIDAVGRVMILNFVTNVNAPAIARRWDNDSVDDLHAVVGSYWLNTTPMVRGMYNPLHSAAVKKNHVYTYESTSTMGNGPYHPNASRSAFLSVTTNGVLKMFWYQNNTNRIEETALELESITSSDEAVTHAAICSDGRCKSYLLP